MQAGTACFTWQAWQPYNMYYRYSMTEFDSEMLLLNCVKFM